MLRELTQIEAARVADAIYQLADLGLVVPSESGFRFSHDQIRDAARDLMPDGERIELHAQIAQLLLAQTPDPRDRILEIADHLQRGHASLPEELHTRAIEIHRLAAERAIASGAGELAEASLQCARSLHGEQDWRDDPTGSFTLILLSVDSASQRNEFDTALGYLDLLEDRCAHELDRVRLVVKRIEVFALRGEVVPALRYALDELRRYGVRWPTEPTRWHARLAVARTRWLLGRRSLAHVLAPSAAPDSKRLAPLLILRQSAGLIGRAGGELSAISACFCLRDAIQNGYLAAPGFLVACYAIQEYRFVQSPERTRDLAMLALELSNGPAFGQDPLAGPQTACVIHSVIYPFLMRRRDALRALPQIAGQLEEVGAVEWTYYTRYLQLVYLALGGDRIDTLEGALQGLARSSAAAASARAPIVATVAALSLLLRPDLECALREAPAVYALFGVGPDATPPGLTLWMQSLWVWDQPEAVIELSDRIEDSIESLNPGVHIVDFLLYRGLAAVSLAQQTSGSARRGHRRTFRRCLRELRRWRRQGPDFEHMSLLLEAEAAWFRGDIPRADRGYATAARRAQQQGFVNHAAIAEERRAQMLQRTRRETNARAAALAAAELYEEWGVPLKARALRETLSDSMVNRRSSRRP